MRSAFKIILLSFFCLSLSFCSMFSKSSEENTTEEKDVPKYENYHSSGVYKDIEGESRTAASEDYSDDDYGDLDDDEEDDDEEFLADADEPEADTDPLPLAQEEPVQVEKLETPKPKKRKRATKRVASVEKSFKNGMYRLGTNCSMRAKPSTSAKKVGKVKKGKKLWMEKHNSRWVKVFKKSGPVYINKVCL